jgi:hypothetical protein
VIGDIQVKMTVFSKALEISTAYMLSKDRRSLIVDRKTGLKECNKPP